MTKLSRRAFGALTAASALALATGGARAQAGSVGFMSFSFAEEPNRPHIQAVIDAFRAAGGAPVEAIGSAWGDVQRNIVLRQRSRTLPDTVQISERWLPALAQLPEIVDLDTVFGKAALAETFDENTLALGQSGGRQLALPLMTGSIGFVANTEVLQRAGVSEIPTTLDQFRAALVAVRDRVPNSVPFAMATKNPNSIPLEFTMLTWAFGGRVIDENGRVLINSAEGRAMMNWVAGLMRERLIAPEIDRPDARRLFAQGAAAFYVDAPQAKSFIRTFSGRGEAADAFTRPMASPVARAGDTGRSIEWGHTVVMFRGAAAPTRESPAARWLAHLMSDATQTTLPFRFTAIPATKSARARPELQGDAYLRAWSQAAGRTMKHEIGVWPNAPELSTILAEETQAAILGQKPADAAVAAMQTRMEASMARRG
jgi:multiple sugar transport system substrate-binding protein